MTTEVNLVDMAARLTAVEIHNAQLLEMLKGTENDEGLVAMVKRIDKKLEKYETRWGVFAMVASAVGAAFVTFKDWILTHFFGQ